MKKVPAHTGVRTPQRRGYAEQSLRLFLCFVVFATPFLFTAQMMPTESPNLPTDLLVWVVLGFTPSAPAFLVGLLSGAALLFAALVYPCPAKSDKRYVVVLPWVLLLLAGCVGLIRSTEHDYACNWFIHFGSAACFATAVWWASAYDQKLLRWLLASAGAAAVILCLHGWYEHFIGMKARLETMKQQHLAQYGEALPERMEAKMAQERLMGFFSDPNTFAAHLLLAVPAALCAVDSYLSRRKKALGFHRIFCLTVLLLIALPAFWWTGSRGAAMGLIGGIAVAVWSLPVVQASRWKWSLPAVAVVAVVAVYVIAAMDTARGGVATASVRGGYYRCAWRMVRDAPLTGQGLGEFFPWYMRTRPAESEVSRDPHSFFCSAISQCGLLGGLAVLCILAAPFAFAVLALRRDHGNGVGSSWHVAAMQGALAAWAIHSFFQFNELIPATLCFLFSWLPLVLFDSHETTGNAYSASIRNDLRIGLCLLGAALMIGVGLRIPGEAALERASMLENTSRQKYAQAMQPNVNEPRRQQLLLESEAAQAAYVQTLKKLSRAMRWTPAPCRMLLMFWQSRMEALRQSGQPIPPEMLRDIHDIAGLLVARTPHRTASWHWIAWSDYMQGNLPAAETAIQQALFWGPHEKAALQTAQLIKTAKEQR